MICKCGHSEKQHDLKSKGECTAPDTQGVGHVLGIGGGFCMCDQFDPQKEKRRKK